jgi:hypothetical protein
LSAIPPSGEKEQKALYVCLAVYQFALYWGRQFIRLARTGHDSLIITFPPSSLPILSISIQKLLTNDFLHENRLGDAKFYVRTPSTISALFLLNMFHFECEAGRGGSQKITLLSQPKEKADSHSAPVLVTRSDDFLAVCNELAADAQHVA